MAEESSNGNNRSHLASSSAAGIMNTDKNPTPSRFLMESGAYNFTPGLITSIVTSTVEVNPFEQSFKPVAQQKQQENGSSSNSPLETDQKAEFDGQPRKNANRKTRSTTASASKANSRAALSNNISNNSFIDGRSDSGSVSSSKGSDNHHSVGDNNNDKRKKFLERNRVAASRCRQRKKQKIEELEKRASETAQRNEELKLTISALKDELIMLKNMLLAHRNCECSLVQEYINNGGLSVGNTPLSPA
jgi:hypothetical protein